MLRVDGGCHINTWSECVCRGMGLLEHMALGITVYILSRPTHADDATPPLTP